MPTVRDAEGAHHGVAEVSVPSSSALMSREMPAISAARIAARRRTTGISGLSMSRQVSPVWTVKRRQVRSGQG